MTSAHLFAHCQAALCVAEDSAVAFFAPKTLKKFRVERLNGARICGLFLRASPDGYQLHVIDVESTWHVLTVKNVTLVSSVSICRHIESDSASASAANGGSQKPKIASRRVASAAGERATEALQSAQFHEVDGVLHAVLLYPSGVYEVTAEQALAGAEATRIMHFLRPLSGCTLAVGRRTGLVVVGQEQQRWLQYSLFSAREKHASSAQRRVLSIAMQTVACSPDENSVAIGGTRGELCVYPNVEDSHFFSDHWHHTALTALSFSADGTALYTGARESVLLLWNLSSYTFKKVTCNLGPINCVVPSASAGHVLLLTCNTSTLAMVDALQMRLQHSVEGIEWAAGEACSGLVVDQWQGEPAVILTGLPNVLRICDPLTQQALYSLHISSQMETIPSPPRHGIAFAGLLREGRLLVTYETFGGSSPLPSLLRFWSYDARQKRHVESQVIYAPHASEVLALQVDKANNRVFTMCAHAIKCWEESLEDANDAYAVRQAGRSWRNQSTMPTPSQLVRAMELSADGSLCFVADDCVHVYDVSRCVPGVAWPGLLDCTQPASTAPLEQVLYLPEPNVVVARNSEDVFFWSLATPGALPAHHRPSSGACTALCVYSESSVLLATADNTFVELDASANHLGAVKGKAEDDSRADAGRQILHMSRLSSENQRLAVVDSASGFRVLNVSIRSQSTAVEQFSGRTDALEAEEREAERATRDFGRYFAEGDAGRATSGADADLLGRVDATKHAHMTQSARYLREVLGEPSYTVPPMSSVLSSFLQRRVGGGLDGSANGGL